MKSFQRSLKYKSHSTSLPWQHVDILLFVICELLDVIVARLLQNASESQTSSYVTVPCREDIDAAHWCYQSVSSTCGAAATLHSRPPRLHSTTGLRSFNAKADLPRTRMSRTILHCNIRVTLSSSLSCLYS